MKKFLVCLVTMVCLLSLSTVTLANSGSAILPYISWSYTSSTHYRNPEFTVSNITNQPITISITVYNSDGTVLDGKYFKTSGNAQNLIANPSSETSVSFTLNAYCTGGTYISGITGMGYGRITWSNSDPNTSQGIVATIGHYTQNSQMSFSSTVIPINNGLPF